MLSVIFAECRYTECCGASIRGRLAFDILPGKKKHLTLNKDNINMLTVIMLSVVKPNVVMLNVIMLSAFAHSPRQTRKRTIHRCLGRYI
jgi:hypothetical protein